MKHQQIYNLEEFANKYQLTDIFGAYAAYFSVGFTQPTGVDVLHHFKEMVQQRTLFTKLLLIRKGTATVVINKQDGRKTLNADSLLVMTSRHVINEIELTPDFEAECVLVDTDMVDENTIYHLTVEKHKSVSDVFNIIHNIVRHQHINKVEMIQSMFNVLRLILEELPYEERSISHDFKHKKEVYEIFLHHLYRNFRKERQIRFYASNMNVSTAYLSRLVKGDKRLYHQRARHLAHLQGSLQPPLPFRHVDWRNSRHPEFQRPERPHQLLQDACRHDSPRLQKQRLRKTMKGDET